MHDADTGNNVGGRTLVPVDGIARFDEKMIFAFVVSNGFGLGLDQEQEVHSRLVPSLAETLQRRLLTVRPNDVTVDDEKRSVAKQRQRLLKPTSGLQGLRFLRNAD